jgi:hypothetical protein
MKRKRIRHNLSILLLVGLSVHFSIAIVLSCVFGWAVHAEVLVLDESSSIRLADNVDDFLRTVWVKKNADRQQS